MEPEDLLDNLILSVYMRLAKKHTEFNEWYTTENKMPQYKFIDCKIGSHDCKTFIENKVSKCLIWACIECNIMIKIKLKHLRHNEISKVVIGNKKETSNTNERADKNG